MLRLSIYNDLKLLKNLGCFLLVLCTVYYDYVTLSRRVVQSVRLMEIITLGKWNMIKREYCSCFRIMCNLGIFLWVFLCLSHSYQHYCSPVDCIHWVTAAQLTLLEDEMRRVERVNVCTANLTFEA